MQHSITIANAAATSSLELSKELGKRHGHIVAAIKKLQSTTHASFVCKPGQYKDSTGRRLPMLMICKPFADLVRMRARGLARIPLRIEEEAALKTIEQLLGVTLIRQFCVLSYRIDGYHAESSTAYEIDEPAHKSKTEKDAARQQEIELAIGCKFVRISL